MRLEDFGGFLGDFEILAFEDEVEENFDGLASLHVGQEFEGEVGSDLRDIFLTEDDLLEKVGFLDGSGRCAGEGVVDEEFQGFLAMLVRGIFDLRDDFGQQFSAVDGFWMQAFGFAFLNFSEVVEI